MARGWESKSVEQQQAEKAERSGSVRPKLSPSEQATNREREGLLLSRKRLLERIQAATHPRQRQMLEQSMAEIDRQLACFDDVAKK